MGACDSKQKALKKRKKAEQEQTAREEEERRTAEQEERTREEEERKNKEFKIKYTPFASEFYKQIINGDTKHNKHGSTIPSKLLPLILVGYFHSVPQFKRSTSKFIPNEIILLIINFYPNMSYCVYVIGDFDGDGLIYHKPTTIRKIKMNNMPSPNCFFVGGFCSKYVIYKDVNNKWLWTYCRPRGALSYVGFREDTITSFAKIKSENIRELNRISPIKSIYNSFGNLCIHRENGEMHWLEMHWLELYVHEYGLAAFKCGYKLGEFAANLDLKDISELKTNILSKVIHIAGECKTNHKTFLLNNGYVMAEGYTEELNTSFASSFDTNRYDFQKKQVRLVFGIKNVKKVLSICNYIGTRNRYPACAITFFLTFDGQLHVVGKHKFTPLFGIGIEFGVGH
eukprot:424809_1